MNHSKAKNLKKVMEASNENDNRDSTTPDSAKESDASKTKSKKRRNGKKKKSSSTSTSKSSVKAPSSDSGTATDDNIERYMEISGFPAVRSFKRDSSLGLSFSQWLVRSLVEAERTSKPSKSSQSARSL